MIQVVVKIFIGKSIWISVRRRSRTENRLLEATDSLVNINALWLEQHCWSSVLTSKRLARKKFQHKFINGAAEKPEIHYDY